MQVPDRVVYRGISSQNTLKLWNIDMRLYLKRAVQCVSLLALLQIVVYFWRTNTPRKMPVHEVNHRYLQIMDRKEGTCTFENCPSIQEGVINVHLIPHSHIDVGWVKSVEQYYIGEMVQNVWASGCVRCTLNATITELLKNTTRRFIFNEMKYLSRYWSEIDEAQRRVIRQLIKERRLEIVHGGWVASDAAVTMYNDIIDQHTLGFDFIRDTFGACAQTKTAWHVDQFGHSREHASIFAQMGYDSLFIGRIDSHDLEQRKRDRDLELLWNTSPQNYKERSTLFTHVTYDGYYAPESFNFEITGPQLSHDYEAERAAVNFIEVLKKRASAYKTGHLLIPMGCDFGYKDAYSWFSNTDILIRKVHEIQQKHSTDMKFNLFYSTPSCYTYYVNKAGKEFQVKTDDFHPYGIEKGFYWTGYFTTRGGLKMHIKKAGQILQSCKQMSVFAGLDETYYKVNKLRDAQAIMQHHDAITGTQRRAVLVDYNRILSEGTKECETVMSTAYNRLRSNEEGGGDSNLKTASYFCHGLNVSACSVYDNLLEFIVSVYNPLSWAVSVPVRFPVLYTALTVIDSEGSQIPAQVAPVPEGITKIPERESVAESEAAFQTRVPPMSATSFKVTFKKELLKPHFEQNQGSEIIIQNEHLSLTFDISTGRLKSIYNKDFHIRENLSQELAYYEAQERERRPSGTYLFVPKKTGLHNITTGKVSIKWVKGEVVEEVHQTFSSWATQIVRLYKGAKYAEFQWVVGPLDNSGGKEVVSYFSSSLASCDKFYTDSNGREVMERTSVRETAGGQGSRIKDFISGNYYPVTSRIFIRDEARRLQLTILPDRAQGGSSLSQGSIELMVHRRLLVDDDLGVGEPLMDNGKDNNGIIYTGKHYLCLDTIENSALLTKHLAHQVHMSPVLMFTPLTADNTVAKPPRQHLFLSAQLPDNIQVLSLDRISEGTKNFFLLRLEHVFEEKEDYMLSLPVEVNLKNLFRPFEIVSAEETTLGGNFNPRNISRMQWDTADKERTSPSIESPDYKEVMEPPFKVTLQPMEIRTFRVQVEPTHSLLFVPSD